jgi:lipid-binding SYLF domain-containing protein
VFPSVIKAGIGIGGEYGEGALLTRERTMDYYNIVSASVGFQLGAQARSVIIVFVTPEALASFRRTHGWKIGVDASVAVVTVGAGGSIDTSRIANPIVGFIFDAKGLMYNLTLEGSKISRIQRGHSALTGAGAPSRGAYFPSRASAKNRCAWAMASSAAAALAGMRWRLRLGSSKPCVAPS